MNKFSDSITLEELIDLVDYYKSNDELVPENLFNKLYFLAKEQCFIWDYNDSDTYKLSILKTIDDIGKSNDGDKILNIRFFLDEEVARLKKIADYNKSYNEITLTDLSFTKYDEKTVSRTQKDFLINYEFITSLQSQNNNNSDIKSNTTKEKFDVKINAQEIGVLAHYLLDILYDNGSKPTQKIMAEALEMITGYSAGQLHKKHISGQNKIDDLDTLSRNKIIILLDELKKKFE